MAAQILTSPTGETVYTFSHTEVLARNGKIKKLIATTEALRKRAERRSEPLEALAMLGLSAQLEECYLLPSYDQMRPLLLGKVVRHG